MSQLDKVVLDYLQVLPNCTACSWCVYRCPVSHCISTESGQAKIDFNICIECGLCVYVCPVNAIVAQRPGQPKARLAESNDGG